MTKSAQAFRTIREVADWLGVQAHVLRFWESKFPQIKPVKRAGGRRYYRPADMALVGGIKRLLHDENQTIRAVQQMIREEGVAQIAALSPPLEPGIPDPAGAAYEMAVVEDHGPDDAQPALFPEAEDESASGPAEAPVFDDLPSSPAAPLTPDEVAAPMRPEGPHLAPVPVEEPPADEAANPPDAGAPELGTDAGARPDDTPGAADRAPAAAEGVDDRATPDVEAVADAQPPTRADDVVAASAGSSETSALGDAAGSPEVPAPTAPTPTPAAAASSDAPPPRQRTEAGETGAPPRAFGAEPRPAEEPATPPRSAGTGDGDAGPISEPPGPDAPIPDTATETDLSADLGTPAATSGDGGGAVPPQDIAAAVEASAEAAPPDGPHRGQGAEPDVPSRAPLDPAPSAPVTLPDPMPIPPASASGPSLPSPDGTEPGPSSEVSDELGRQTDAPDIAGETPSEAGRQTTDAPRANDDPTVPLDPTPAMQTRADPGNRPSATERDSAAPGPERGAAQDTSADDATVAAGNDLTAVQPAAHAEPTEAAQTPAPDEPAATPKDPDEDARAMTAEDVRVSGPAGASLFPADRIARMASAARRLPAARRAALDPIIADLAELHARMRGHDDDAR